MPNKWKKTESNLVKATEIDPEKFLTAREAAAFLYISYDTLALWRRLEKHCIPYMRIGNHIFYRYADLVAFRDKHFNIENYATSTDAKEGAVK